jgi:hypothetical protein
MKDSATGQTLQKVEGLWFHSDLVILQAGARIFRVFTAILREKSPVFADMFSFPQPSDPQSADDQTLDRVPVVKMHDDPAELEVFLKAIFDSRYTIAATLLRHSIDWEVVSSQFFHASSEKDSHRRDNWSASSGP